VKAMVLAAGEGTRLRPLTLNCPKPMLPLAGRPLLEYTLEWLRRHGIVNVAINLHHRPEAIIDHFGDGKAFDVRITYSLEETILGTAGGVRKLQSYFDGTFVVVYGDVLTNLDLTALVGFHRHKEALATMTLYQVDNPWECGIVELDGEGRISRFVEKPPRERVFSRLANAGVYVLEPMALDFIPADSLYDFGRDLFPDLVVKGLPVYGYPIAEYLIDVGTPAKYRQAETDLLTGRVR